MSNVWIWISAGVAGVVIATVATVTYVQREPGIPVIPGMPVPQKSIFPETGNPLLRAGKEEVKLWFPSLCFAEIYMKDPSFNGGLIDSCVQDVIRKVKADTGIELTPADVRSPEAFAHFKKVLGADGPWLR